MIFTSEYPGPSGPGRGGGTARANLARGRALIKGLHQGGVRDFVVSPGSRNTPLIVALERLVQWDESTGGEATVRVHRVLDERAAGFLGLGLGRASGRPVALVCTSGSAAAHYFPAVMEAYYSEVPLVVLSADRPPELQGCGAPQTVNQTNLYGHYAGHFFDLGAPETEAESEWVAEHVAGLLTTPGTRRGVVHLNVPFRKELWSAEAEAGLEWGEPESRPRSLEEGPGLPEAVWEQLVADFESADRGCIVVGPRCEAFNSLEDRFPEALLLLAEVLGWPVLAEPASSVRFRGESEYQVAMGEGILRSPGAAGLLKPDRVLRFGRFPTSKSIGAWLTRHGESPVVWVSTSVEVQDPIRTVTHPCRTDPTLFCDRLRARLGARRGPPREAGRRWSRLWATMERVAEQEVSVGCADLRAPLWEGEVSHLVGRCLPASGALHVASSMPIRDLDSFAFPREGVGRVFSSRGTNGIDGTLATGLGEALAQPAAPMVVLLGDQAALHDLGGLHLLKTFWDRGALRAPFVVVVVDNNGGGIFGNLPIAAHPTVFERSFVTPHNVSLSSVVAGIGLPCVECETGHELALELESGLSASEPRVVIARVEREFSSGKRRDVWARIEAALGPVVAGESGEGA